MDRQGASLDYTIESMKQRLRIKPLVLQLPMGELDHFNSVIDLISMEEIRWLDKYGNEVDHIPVDKHHPMYQKVVSARDDLLGAISEFDDKIAEIYLEGSTEQLNQQLLYAAIKKIINEHPDKTCPVLVGSALKNRGMQPLLDAVKYFLPGPSERPMIVDISNPENKRKLDKQEKLCAYVYKIV